MNHREKWCSITLLLLGGILLVAGIAIVVFTPMLTWKIINEEIPLRTNSFIKRIWQDPPYTITIQFWIFNVTNPSAVLHEGARPAMVQKGPYGYREVQRKENVTYLEDQSISYVNKKTYYFDPELSCPTCLLNDTFVIPNIPYLTADRMIDESITGPHAQLFKVAGKAALLGMGDQIFKANITAAQLIFDGYEDDIFQMAKSLMPTGTPTRMGIFYGRNDTNDGVYVINSGIQDVTQVGQIITWQGNTNLSFKGWWNSVEANRISGSDGTLYKPFVQRTDTLETFVSEICRSVQLVYSADIDFQGIKTYRFRLSKASFDTYSPRNKGFCWPMANPVYNISIQPLVEGGWCLPTGMNDISKCQFGAPIVLSMPQFVFAPDEVRESIRGLFPQSEDYLSYVDIEPTTGVMLSGSRTAQLNAIVQPEPGDLLSRNMKPVIIPIAWINETAVVDSGTRDYVYQNVVVLKESVFVVAYAALGTGILWIVCVAVGLSIWRQNRKNRRQQLADDLNLPQ